IAYELNDELLTQKNGFPARLVIPGFYGTNCVKWLCRLELRECRATTFMTTSVYSDPDLDADPSGETTKPVCVFAAESIFVSPKPDSTIKRNAMLIWGWAWSSCAVQFVEVSTDGGESWTESTLEPCSGLSWQRFCHAWVPPSNGPFELRCRATDESGKTQPV